MKPLLILSGTYNITANNGSETGRSEEDRREKGHLHSTLVCIPDCRKSNVSCRALMILRLLAKKAVPLEKARLTPHCIKSTDGVRTHSEIDPAALVIGAEAIVPLRKRKTIRTAVLWVTAQGI